MTTILFADVTGRPRGEAVVLKSRRRRLATVLRPYRQTAQASGRPFIVSVHRAGELAYAPTDASVRVRGRWSRVLVGPRDVVLITYLPLGGGGRSGGGGGKGFATIGLALASIALIALAPYVAPLAAGSLLGLGGAATGSLSFAIQAGMVVGGLALGAAAQASSAAKRTQAAQLYSVSGGGNLPKPGARKPLLYGKSWSAPPLSQADYFLYDGDTMVLTKRMTLGLGKFQIHRIRIGDATLWNETAGVLPPFNATAAGSMGTAVEILYQQPSQLASGDVISSPSVSGQDMPRPGGNPDRTPWFRLTPQGVTADAALFSWTYPAVYRVTSKGVQVGTVAGVVFIARLIDTNTGAVLGPEFELHRSSELTDTFTTTPLRRSAYVRLPQPGTTYEVCAQNAYPDPVGFQQENRSTWDGMSAFRDDLRVRPNTTEIVLRIRAGKGLTITAYSDVMVEATRIVPVWNGSAWVDQATSKAVWAYADLVRSDWGLAKPSGFDTDRAAHYAGELTSLDTFDGALPEVSSFWEAAGTVLHPMRADPVKVGNVHSFVRDESRDEARHVLSRRNIVLDSSRQSYQLAAEGRGDVIVEFLRDGDPKRPDEARYSYGTPSRTPKRYKVDGIRDGVHALKHATWLAAVDVFRGAERSVVTEWDGRLIYPGDHVLSDLWFLKGKSVYGVTSANGRVLRLDVRASLSPDWGYGSIRTRVGREWGILRMRGSAPGYLELHPDDVAALEARSGLALSAVLARETQDPTTIVLGDLVELQETYLVRSAIPADADHVQIDMVCDDARVWQLLNEDVAGPLPVNADSQVEPLVPEISVLHARCMRIETGIEVAWGVSVTRGARTYEVEMTYDGGATWETLSPVGPASSGRAPMRQTDQPVTVRARAYGRTGLHGEWVSASFTTMAPVVQGELVADLSLSFDKMSAQLQKDIASINEQGAGLLAFGAVLTDDYLAAARALQARGRDLIQEGEDATTAALRYAAEVLAAAGSLARGGSDLAGDAIRGILRQHDEALNRLAADAATQAADAYEQRQVLKVAVGGSFAAVERETRLRVSADEVLASVSTTLAVRLDVAEGGIVANATAIQGVSARVTSAEGVIDAQSRQITTLSARIDANDLAISGQATATQVLSARVTLNEGSIVSLSEAVTTLQARVNTHDGLLSGQATALDSLTARTGIVEGRIESEATRTTALEASVNAQGGLISGQATALSQLTTRASASEDRIETEARRTDVLATEVFGPDGRPAATANAVSELATRTSTAEGRIESQASAINAIGAIVTSHGDQITGHTTAIDSLSVRTSATEAGVSSLAQRTTALEASVSTQGGLISGQATALSQLTARTAATEGEVESQASRLDSLSSTVSTQGGQIAGTADAVSQLTTRATASEARIETETRRTDVLATEVFGPDGRPAATANAVSELATRTSTAEGRIETEARRTDVLATEVFGPDGRVSGQARAIDDLGARTSATEGGVTSVANRTAALEASVSSQGGQIGSNSQALQDLSVRTSAAESGLSTQAQQLSNLASTVTGQEGQISAQAQAASNLSTRVETVEGVAQSQSTQITSLSTTQSGHSAQLTTLAASYDGVRVQYGVTGYIDGQTGGFVLTGAKRLDGGSPFQLLVSADMFVDGLLTARMMSTSSLITTSAQIGSLTVDNINVKDGAISTVVAAQSSGLQASVSINVRTNNAVIILINRVGDLSSRFRQGSNMGALRIECDGNLIFAAPADFTMEYDGSAGGSYLRPAPTTFIHTYAPGVGGHAFTVKDDNNVGIGGVRIILLESK